MFTAIMIGAGARGIGVYGDYATKHKDEIRFVAVAEPDPERRLYFAFQHQIPESHQFSGFREILDQGKIADICFVCTQDNMHIEPAIKAIKLGYDLFLEKPMAVTPEDCLLLGQMARKHKTRVMIGHVLRYTMFFSTIKRWLDEGRIGRLMSIQHNENVSYWHQAHSYVRGNWRNERLSSPMLLAKSCHDLDLMVWFANSRPKQVSSFGRLSHFKTEMAPEGAPEFCLDGCPHQDTCIYYAPRVYLNAPIWMKLAVNNDMSDEGLLKALKAGPYGRCVYRSDNDVVDHQVTIVEFANEVTVAFTMTGFTNENTRTIKLMGTEGEIRGHLDKNELELLKFGSDTPETVSFADPETGHGGGDEGIMHAFIDSLSSGDSKWEETLDQAIESHLLAFAAEVSRKQRRTVDFSGYIDTLDDLEYGKATSEDRLEAIELSTRCFNTNMRKQFLLLLGENNRNRMFVAKNKDKVISMVNYYPSTIKLDDVCIKVGSIGSVATDANYRGRGIASKLLAMAETKMHEEKIRLAIISGDGPLYERFGSTLVGNILGYRIDKEQTPVDREIQLVEYKDSLFPHVKYFHGREKYRYLRSDTEFRALIAGQTFPGELFDTQLYLLKCNNDPVGYVLAKHDLRKKEVLIREFAGDRESIVAAIDPLLRLNAADYVILPVVPNDPINGFLKGYPAKMTHQYASFKVIDWEGMILDLKPYLNRNSIKTMSIKMKPDMVILEINGFELQFASIHEVHHLFFGPNRDLADEGTSGDIARILKQAFPLSFVWTNNFNYQ